MLKSRWKKRRGWILCQNHTRLRVAYGTLCLLAIILTCVSVIYVNSEKTHLRDNHGFGGLFDPRAVYHVPNSSCLNASFGACHANSSVVWNNPSLDILNQKPYSFLPNFKNPCWFEYFTDVDLYRNNVYGILSQSVRLTMLDLMEEWSRRLALHKPARRLRCLPYFLIVGQPKCGTTDLFSKITSHPDVVNPPIKELHWWSRNRQGRRLGYKYAIPLEDYVDMFDKAAHIIEQEVEPLSDPEDPYHHVITGEASVSVLWDNDDWWHFPENQGGKEPAYTNAHYVRHVLPEAKIIVILRDPAERLYSDYLYFQKTNKSVEDFGNKVLQAVEVFTNCTIHSSRRSCAYNVTVAMQSKVRLRIGMYYIFLMDWLKVFPRDQILILRAEDYAVNIEDVMEEVNEFLELRPLSNREKQSVLGASFKNRRKVADQRLGQMDNYTKAVLRHFYHPFTTRLASLLGDKRFLWQTYGTRDLHTT